MISKTSKTWIFVSISEYVIQLFMPIGNDDDDDDYYDDYDDDDDNTC